MGLFDVIKGLFGGGKGASEAPPTEARASSSSDSEESDLASGSGASFDVAGFNVEADEEAFFNAVLHMESEGQFGGTDESREEIMSRFEIRDRSHWQTVKDSCYSLLVRKYGSGDEVAQREANWRSGQMQRHMQGQQAKMAASGGFKPVQGVTLEAWAAMNASIAAGTNPDDVLKGAGLSKARWDAASAEWNARMSADTTFAITTVYGNAFQAASQGKYASLAKEANAARAANRDLALPMPMTWEQYFEIMYEQSLAPEPVAALRGMGLTIVDWTDLSSFMGYHINRNGVREHAALTAAMNAGKAKAEARHPGKKADLDIQF